MNAMVQARTILVADDDSDIRGCIADVLAQEGYSVETAADGGEAIARLETPEPRSWFVLLDLMMPKVSGYEVLRYLQEAGRHSTTSVVVFTASNNPRLPPGTRWCRKPIELEELLELVETGGALGEQAQAAQ